MSGVATPLSAPCARTVALHSLGWLVAANLVGLWLGASLLWPELGNALAPLTWGRWTPLHMTWHLYGWCALPAVGVLFAWNLDSHQPAAPRQVRFALGAWSAALVAGGIAWLGGAVSGKLFLDWHGWARPLLPLAMAVLWGVLAWHVRTRWPYLPRHDRIPRVVVLGLLTVVPGIIFWASGRDMYHPVNPGSGGATGAALLGSVAGIVTIFQALPPLLGMEARGSTKAYRWALAGSWLVFAMTDRGNVSHHARSQIAALATLLVWVPLLPRFWRLHAWPLGARPWLDAASVWWSLLIVTGWLSFLPGLSESFKFTHALVGHAHLAMAGLLTCVNAVILVTLTGRAPARSVFWLWQGGCAVYIASMLGLGWGESQLPSALFRSEVWTQAFFAVRLAAGAAMAVASVRWLVSVARS
jgi:cytochrome c oxidase cbb3-type subunit 1